MSYIYNTGRIELYEQIKRYSNFINGRVLDIGSGNYSRYKKLFNFNEYVKLDIKPGTNVDIVGKIESLPIPDSSFDSIVCTQVLGDVYELKKAFGELHRVLKTNGTILITESFIGPLHDEPNDFWRFTEHGLRRLTEDSGFHVIVLDRLGGYRSVMAQMRARYLIERYQLNKKWFRKIFSFIFKILGGVARYLDKKDMSDANRLFTHGYILIAKKYA